MRRSIRLALPVVAAATALALTGCNSDEESPFDGPNPGDGGQEETEGGASEGETGGETPEETTGGETGGEVPGDTTGGETGGDTGGETGTIGGDTGGSGGGDAGGSVEGDWYTGTTIDDANLEITSGDDTVTFYEDFGQEGDVCEGTITNGTISLDSCDLYGDSEWTDMEATYTVDGSTMQVTWSSGASQTYYNALGGGFSEAEITELQEMLQNLPGAQNNF
ncbi:hypothetical protein [Streptomyces johnsoniae]|uniref:Lipoprotein n=1 Tax=Streptomyces johnsoniae TaxID=3075532 RepID=A0ABU2S4Y4_9ACTN|nr:hypothetical protein [Streptomyces sp. DSM 41886]MDT0443868.1 hypothetical protein [Streptomyces sp. DSM 41886]